MALICGERAWTWADSAVKGMWTRASAGSVISGAVSGPKTWAVKEQDGERPGRPQRMVLRAQAAVACFWVMTRSTVGRWYLARR